MARRLLATAMVFCAASAALGRAAPGQQWAHPAVVRVIAPEGNGASMGSGALVGVNQTHGLVVTNWHVVRDARGPIQVVFPDGFRSGAALLATDRDWDLAALAIRRPNVQPIDLATAAPRRGDLLTIAGYGSGRYRASMGRCTQYVSPGRGLPFEMVELDTAARQGDSGGPILNQRGELAGVLFGAGFGRTTGSYCGRVRRFLGQVADDFQRLAPEPTTPEPIMIARRPPPVGAVAGPSGSGQGAVGEANRGTRPRPAPIVAITGGPYPLPSSDAADEAPPRREIAELPVARPEAAPVAVTSPADSPAPSPGPARPTLIDQIKTALACFGLVALLFHGLRLLGQAAG